MTGFRLSNGGRRGGPAGLLLTLLVSFLQAVCASVLTLEETISLALRQNLGLQQNALQVEIRDNEVRSAEGARQPNLTLSASFSETVAGQSFSPDGIFDQGGAEFRESLSASLNSSLTLFDGGQISASIEAARYDLEAARYEYDREREALLLDAVSAHLLVVLRKKQVVLQEEDLANRRQELEEIRVHVQNGLRVEAEWLRQQALVSAAERDLLDAQRQAAVAVLNLQNLLHLSIGAPLDCQDPEATWGAVESFPAPDAEAARVNLDQRLDLEAQRARLEAARQSVRLAGLGDHLTVQASARFSSGASDGGGSTAFNQFTRTEPSAAASLSLNWPLFDRRRTETSLLRANLQLRQEELFLQILASNAWTALQQSILNYTTARAQLAAAQEQWKAAEAALAAEQARYAAGLATLLEVSTLRTARLTAAVAVAQARHDLFVGRLSVAFQDGTIETYLLDRLPSLSPVLP